VTLHGCIWPAGALVAALAVAGCGQPSGGGHPALGTVPLAPGLRVVADSHRCDRGANPYCAEQVVVVGRAGSSSALVAREKSRLKALGWSASQGDTGKEQAADSPGHALRLTYAGAQDDLQAYDMGWIHRAPSIVRALSRTMFERTPALSLMLQTGPS
jgi:hypothetical protein